jgi:methylmalonyl-CoA mutase cobalamin-binding domain/chain
MVYHKFNNVALQGIYDAMVEIDAEKTPRLAEKALRDGVDVLKIVDVLTKGINTVGDKFEAMECFLPELIIAARIMDESMTFLRPELVKQDLAIRTPGTIVIANLQGDIHDIGRKIATVILQASGFVVHDLGHDVKPDVIIDKAVELKADVIGLSSLLTTSLPYSKDTINLLQERGLRDQFKVVMGGAAVTPYFCKDILADGYCKDAVQGVKVISKLLSGK